MEKNDIILIHGTNYKVMAKKVMEAAKLAEDIGDKKKKIALKPNLVTAKAPSSGGSVEAFAEKMNRKAREIGCVDTTFLTPNGLDAEGKNADGEVIRHSTTAAELAKILRYCTEVSPKRDEFLTITRTGNHAFSDQDGTHTYSCRNHNALLEMTQVGHTNFVDIRKAHGKPNVHSGRIFHDHVHFITQIPSRLLHR